MRQLSNYTKAQDLMYIEKQRVYFICLKKCNYLFEMTIIEENIIRNFVRNILKENDDTDWDLYDILSDEKYKLMNEYIQAIQKEKPSKEYINENSNITYDKNDILKNY